MRGRVREEGPIDNRGYEATNGGQSIAYNRSTGSCALVCHGQAHGGAAGVIKNNSR